LARDRLHLRSLGTPIRTKLAPEQTCPGPSQPTGFLVSHTRPALQGQRASRSGAVYRRLFSLKPELILYDITSTYFEGAGPENFAKHGYSRDSKPHNVQIVVVVVMVSGWPIAHHVWPENRIDHDTVQEVVRDLYARFGFSRIIFGGDRGIITAENLESLKRDQQGFMVGLNRRRNAELKEWLNLTDETKWMNCPVGITTQERKTDPPRTRAQEVSLGDPGMRVIIVDSDERRAYEQAMRERSIICRRVGAVGSATSRPATGGRRDRVLREPRDRSPHNGTSRSAWKVRPNAQEWRGLARCPAGVEGAGDCGPASADPSGWGRCDHVMTFRKSGACAAMSYVT
jgi:hypothetical protein